LRRWIARSLIAIFCGIVFMPLTSFGSQTPGDLPACGRRNGKHHCTQLRVAVADFEAEFIAPVSSAPEKCPHFPGILSKTTHNPRMITATGSGTRARTNLDRTQAILVGRK
jgi:hypothetical protein